VSLQSGRIGRRPCRAAAAGKESAVRKPALLFLLAAGVTLVAPGCFSAVIREGSGAVLGAKGTFMPIVPLIGAKVDRPLGAYSRFELGTITDEIGGQMPPEFVSLLGAAFTQQARKAGLPDIPNGRTLLLRGAVVHYESASTMGFVLGPLEEAIVRAEMVDKATGKVLATANCLGRTEARVNAGPQEKAEGVAKGMVKWIESGFPEHLKVKKKDRDREREQ
jgi:hypothetical protein